MKNEAKIAVIGGSGLYEIPGLRSIRQLPMKTPFGDPSGPITLGEINGVECAFLPRHGIGHVLLPSEINARANIWALKSLGVARVIAVSAVGSLREDFAPLHFVVPDQIVDRTKGRTSTFFGQGIVAHVTFDRPFCADQSKLLFEKAQGLGLTVHSGGAYLCMDGPAFSTKAESELHRKLGCSIIGMTAIPKPNWRARPSSATPWPLSSPTTTAGKGSRSATPRSRHHPRQRGQRHRLLAAACLRRRRWRVAANARML